MPATLSMAKGILGEFHKCGITHAIALSDSCIKTIYDLLLHQNEITLIPVCREGEAIGIAHGLILGGKVPVILHQNSGFFESGIRSGVSLWTMDFHYFSCLDTVVGTTRSMILPPFGLSQIWIRGALNIIWWRLMRTWGKYHKLSRKHMRLTNRWQS